jgi:DNA repair exonuclease SbcCD ATPase subunit
VHVTSYSIKELVDQPLPISTEDRAFRLREKIDEAEEMESEIEDLRHEVGVLEAENKDAEDEKDEAIHKLEEATEELDKVTAERNKLRRDLDERDRTIADLEGRSINLDAAAASGAALDMLRDLVAAFETSRIGKMAKVGSLVVIAPGGSVAEALGALVAKAKALVSAEVAP